MTAGTTKVDAMRALREARMKERVLLARSLPANPAVQSGQASVLTPAETPDTEPVEVSATPTTEVWAEAEVEVEVEVEAEDVVASMGSVVSAIGNAQPVFISMPGVQVHGEKSAKEAIQEPAKTPVAVVPVHAVQVASKGRAGASLKPLVDAGVLPLPAVLVLRYKGAEHRGSVNDAGQVVLPGLEPFDSPSRAALSVIDRGTINGWDAWRVESVDGCPKLTVLRALLSD